MSLRKGLSVGAAVLLSTAIAEGAFVTNLVVDCARYLPQTKMSRLQAWAPDGLGDRPVAVYVLLEREIGEVADCLSPLMANGTVPPGMVVTAYAGDAYPETGVDEERGRGLRAVAFDSVGPTFPSAIAEEVVPVAASRLGVTVDPSPDRHFITGTSSGGLAAFNACWFRNDYFRRCFCSSPTFSNIRGGNSLMPLVRKCETRPIRAWINVGTDEPDYFFGDSYHVAADAAGALRFAGYEVRYDRFVHEGHGTHYWDGAYLGKVLAWLFADWRTKPVKVAANPIRVRQLVVKGTGWTPCDVTMPPPRTECRSTDGWRVYYVNPTNRFVMTDRVRADGVRDQSYRLAPLELSWNVSQPGGKALAHLADDRLLVATELGVQGVVTFGISDLVLPLPGDLPCDNVMVVGTNLYAASGTKVFSRPLNVPAANPSAYSRPTVPGYDDGFWYSREHAPAGDMGEMLGSYVMAGRIAGVVSVLSDSDYNVRTDCVGWADIGGDGRPARKMADDAVFAIFSMTKTFTGAAIMCAIDERKMSLDDAVSKYLPEFADVKMKDGTRPKRALTVRDLTSHVSGFRSDVHVVDRDIPLREVARQLAAQPLQFQPGETFEYGNAWVDAAAACLELAVGEPYEKYLQRKILDPLGMRDTTFWPGGGQLARLVKTYNSDDTPLRPGNDPCTPQLEFPKRVKIHPAASGGLFSTPRDMIRFSQMLAHHGEWKGCRLISRKTFDTVFAMKQTSTALEQPYTCGS